MYFEAVVYPFVLYFSCVIHGHVFKCPILLSVDPDLLLPPGLGSVDTWVCALSLDSYEIGHMYGPSSIPM